MENAGKAKKKRKSYRGAITKLLNKTEETLSSHDGDELLLLQLQVDLKEKSELLRALDEEIFDLMIENSSEEACDKEAEEATEIREKITYGLVSLETP